MIQPPNDGTVIGYMMAAAVRMQALLIYIDEARAEISNGYNLAVQEGKPTAQIRLMQSEMQTIRDIIGKQIMPTVQMLAEIETGSKG
jgi:hypothetical protein